MNQASGLASGLAGLAGVHVVSSNTKTIEGPLVACLAPAYQRVSYVRGFFVQLEYLE